MEKKKHGLSGFARGLLLYILIAVLLGAAALAALTLYLDAFEQSRPVMAVRAYLQDAREGRLDYTWGYTLAQMDTRIQTEEEALAFAQALLGGASCRELLTDTEGLSRFGLYDENGFRFATLSLKQSGEERWGFRSWKVSEVSTALDGYTHSISLTLPEDYSVELNGVVLDKRFVAEQGIGYDQLAACAELVSPLPTMQRWEIGPCLTETSVRVLDREGREVPEEERETLRYLDTCMKEDRERLSAFIEEYLNVYLPYAGDLRGGGISWWSELSHKIVRGGELEERLLQARKGFGYGNTNDIDLLGCDYVFFCDLREGHYLVDFAYTTETEGLHGKVEETNYLRLLIADTEKGLLTEAMYSY